MLWNRPWPPAASDPHLVTASTVHLLAPNTSPWTYEGTNTWLVGAVGGTECAVVDPGSAADTHLASIKEVASRRGWSIAAILATHHHDDHVDGAHELRRSTGALIYANQWESADTVIGDGDRVVIDGLRLDVLHTPGHSDDSLTFWLPGDATLLTGDTILGGRSAAIFGRLEDFFASMTRLRAFERERVVTILPGHGRPQEGLVSVIDRVVATRRRRVREVEELVSAGETDAVAITELIYPGLEGPIQQAAQSSVRAARDYVLGQSSVGDRTFRSEPTRPPSRTSTPSEGAPP